MSPLGSTSVDGDQMFVSSALGGQIIGLKKEGMLRWRARFFDLDLGTLEIAPLSVALEPERTATQIVPAVTAEVAVHCTACRRR